jgi:hypothetical protein
MRAVLIGVLAATACGASSVNRKAVIEARYQADFATVWNAMSSSVKEDFPSEADKIRTEDAIVGYIETKWEAVDRIQDSTVGDSDQRSNQTASGVRAVDLFRVTARIEPGGPPWRVIIDGEAAQYRPNMTMLQPYKHGAIDEPPWVPGRTDRVRMRMHEKLKQFLVAAPKERAP